MPIQFQPNAFERISFGEANPQLMRLQTNLANYIQAAKAANAPAAEQASVAQAQNQGRYLGSEAGLNNEKTNWYGRDIGSQIAQRMAEAGYQDSEKEKNRYLLKHPGFLGGDISKELAGLNAQGINGRGSSGSGMSGTEGINSPSQNSQAVGSMGSGQFIKTGNPLADKFINAKLGAQQYQQKMANGFNWVHSPPDTKNYLIAQAAGMGINPDIAISEFSNGTTIEELAKKNGFDANGLPAPDFLPTKGNIQKLKERQASLASLKPLDSFINKGLGQYASTIGNYSPSQIKDAISGENPDKQSDFLAARALVPEQSLMRLNAAGGKITVQALSEMKNKALVNIEPFRTFVSKDVWQDVQKKIDNQIEKVNEANAASYTLKGQNKSNSSSSEQKADTHWEMVNGKLVQVK